MAEIQVDQINLIDVLANVRIINISEIKIIQEVVSFIETHYKDCKSTISVAEVTALILNRDDIPNLYATSKRGHHNQILEFQNQFGINGFKIKEKLVPWALDKVIRSGLSQNLNQDLTQAIDVSKRSAPLNSESLLEIAASIDLANVVEFQVIKEAVNHINLKYSQAAKKINLSDVCALVLNHDDVISLYATSEAEYNKLQDTYIAKYQSQTNAIIHKMVEKIYHEGSEYSLSHDSLVAVNFQRRKKLAKFWNI